MLLLRHLAPDGRDPGFSYLTTQAADNAQGSTGAYVGFGFVMVLIFKIAFYFRMSCKVGPQVMPIYSGDEV